MGNSFSSSFFVCVCVREGGAPNPRTCGWSKFDTGLLAFGKLSFSTHDKELSYSLLDSRNLPRVFHQKVKQAVRPELEVNVLWLANDALLWVLEPAAKQHKRDGVPSLKMRESNWAACCRICLV